jgi:hypothetical protein
MRVILALLAALATTSAPAATTYTMTTGQYQIEGSVGQSINAPFTLSGAVDISLQESFWYAQGHVSVAPLVGFGIVGLDMSAGGYNGTDFAKGNSLKQVQPTAWGIISGLGQMISVSATYAFLDNASPLGPALISVSLPDGLSVRSMEAPLPGALLLFATGLLGIFALRRR